MGHPSPDEGCVRPEGQDSGHSSRRQDWLPCHQAPEGSPAHAACSYCWVLIWLCKHRRITTSFSANSGLIRCLGPHGRASCCVHSLLACVNKLSNTKDVIMQHEENHGITLRCLKQVLIPLALQRHHTWKPPLAQHVLSCCPEYTFPLACTYQWSTMFGKVVSVRCGAGRIHMILLDTGVWRALNLLQAPQQAACRGAALCTV